MRPPPDRVYLHDPITKAAEQGKDITLRCRWCKHEKRMPAAELEALCRRKGWPLVLNLIGGNLVCSVCGGKWPILVVVQEG